MLKKRFAVVKEWKHTVSAEDECLMRIKQAAKKLGYLCEAVDQDYRRIDVDSSLIATEKDFDFVIHIHYCSAKKNNLFSFVALWNPEDFYHIWGYRQYSDNLMSHDDFLSCGSKGAEIHLHRLLANDHFHKSPIFYLYHTLEDPIVEPVFRQDRRLHYCGMNWERLTSKKGRHSDLLKFLDDKGVIDIYGPEKFQGVRPWAGYQGYKGEVPFDGSSMIQKISQSGIALVLSSEAHLKAGMMSNRLFEAMAAGVPIICDGNIKAKDIIGDNGYYIDPSNPEDIIDTINHINSNPEDAISKSRECQQIFLNQYRMSIFIDSLYQKLIERKKELAVDVKEDDSITVIFLVGLSVADANKSIQNIFDQIQSNLSKNDYAYLVVPNQFSIKEKQSNVFYHFLPEGPEGNFNFGSAVAEILRKIKTKYFSIVKPNEYLYKDHCRSLIKTLEIEGGDVAISDHVLKVITDDGTIYQAKQTLRAIHENKTAIISGAFVVKSNLLNDDLIATVEGLEEDIILIFLLGNIKIIESRKFSLLIDYYKTKNYRDLSRLADLRLVDTLDVLTFPVQMNEDPNEKLVLKIRRKLLFLKKYKRVWLVLRLIGRRFL